MSAEGEYDYDEYEYYSDESDAEVIPKKKKKKISVCCYAKGVLPVLESLCADNNWNLMKRNTYSRTQDRCDFYHIVKTEDVLERLALMSTRQRVCRILGMNDVCQKVAFVVAMRRLEVLFPGECPSWPETLIMPDESAEIQARMKKFKKGDCFIVKPDDGSQGDGIFLAMAWRDVELKYRTGHTKCSVVQPYIPRPLLLDGRKFDLRLYVLITSLQPLTVYVAEEGLARVCTETYQAPARDNLYKATSHLTNYSLNKRSEKFTHSTGADGGDSSKRAVSAVFAAFAEQGVDVDTLWCDIDAMVLRTMLSLAPDLLASQHDNKISEDDPRCYQVLGFDVLLDEELSPHLLEVNSLPSLSAEEEVRIDADHPLPAGEKKCKGACWTPYDHFHRPSPVDLAVKSFVVGGVLDIVMEERDAKNPVLKEGFRCVAPSDEWDVLMAGERGLLLRCVPIYRAISRDGKIVQSRFRSVLRPACSNSTCTTQDLDIMFRNVQKAGRVMNFTVFMELLFNIAARRDPSSSATLDSVRELLELIEGSLG